MNCQSTTKLGYQCRRTAMENGFCPTHGGSIVSRVKKGITAIWEGPSGKASSRFQAFLDKHKGNRVTAVVLGRKPIVSVVHNALDVISFGKFSKKAKELNYDKVYHNFLLVTLDNGKTYKLEKNETVVDKPAKPSDYENSLYNIPLNGRELTLPQMIDAASAGNKKRFYTYRANGDNCQQFTREIIVRNGLLPENAGSEFDRQDSRALVDTLPAATHFIPNAVTDAAAVADRVIHGDGLKLFRKKKILCPL